MKSFPKVQFTTASVDETIRMINNTLTNEWGPRIINNNPELKKALAKSKNQTEKEIKTYKFFKELESRLDLEKKRKEFQKSWDKINNNIMKALEKLMEHPWPKEIKIIKARVNLNPVCPRYLRQNMFDLNYFYTNEKMKELSLHEILHFIWFDKCKGVFPKMPKKHYDNPYLFWKLSEMVPYLILNDSIVQKALKHEARIYPEFHKININKRPLLEQLQEIYDNKNNLEDFMKKSWKFIKKHEKQINK